MTGWERLGQLHSTIYL